MSLNVDPPPSSLHLALTKITKKATQKWHWKEFRSSIFNGLQTSSRLNNSLEMKYKRMQTRAGTGLGPSP